MKELVFVAGENCQLSEEVSEKVKLFQILNPEITVTKITAEKDQDTFFEKTNGYRFSATPAFASIENGAVIDIHEGWACENRLLKMFSKEAAEEGLLENVELMNAPGPKKVILFFASSDCLRDPETCEKYDKDFEELLNEFPEIEFLRVDVEGVPNPVPDNCYNQSIFTVPTLFLIKNHVFIKSREGSFALQDLKDFIS
jgi:hypothetical protein